MAAAPPADIVIAPRPTRRQARLARKKQQRRRIGLLGGTAIVVAVVVVLGLVAFGVNKAVNHGGGHGRTQTTVLFQLQASDGTAAATALLAHDGANGEGVEVLVPGRVITNVCGYNTESFGGILSLSNGESASRQAVSAMLGGITVDGSWVLTGGQLSHLIDRIGGITVDVDTNVTQRTSGGGARILVPAGANQKLTGGQAVLYATYSTSGTADASGQLARLQRVIDATAQALPHDATAIAALLRQLGPGGGSTMGAMRLASFLAGFAASERSSTGLYASDLPVTSIDSGGTPSYRVDPAGAHTLVTGHLAHSVPAGAGASRPTVELLNGVGTPGLVATACPRLVSHGLQYAGSGNAGSFSNAPSTVVVSTSNVELGYRVAAALGLPRSDVRRTTIDQSVADVIVTLGRDYRP